MKNMIYRQQLTLSLVTGVMVAAGIAVGMVIAPVMAQSTYAKIGYVDLEKCISSHPKTQSVMAQINAFQKAKQEELKKEFSSTNTLTDAQRQLLMERLAEVQKEVDAERKRLTEPIIQDVLNATKKIGEESGPSGLEVILEGGSVIYGGLDLTPEVIRRIQKQ